jgi:DNA-binding transcriptional ArsR family regulator
MLYFYNMSIGSKDDRLFKALADGRRRAILDLLKSAPRTTGAICDHFAGELDRCTVMQHLGVLERAGLVIARRDGRLRWNYLNAAPVKEMHDRWISPYAVNAVALLTRMKKDMERRGLRTA